MKRYQRFAILWAINTIILYLAAMLLPANYSLGNHIFTPMQAALFTGFVWNYVLWNVEPMSKDLEIDLKSPTTMMLVYLGVNFASIWLLARLAFMSGFGVSSYMYAFILALVANLVQYGAWRMMEKK
ncbi:hypothetical protein ACFL2C_02640 [Patescibacteria group bacterium]